MSARAVAGCALRGRLCGGLNVCGRVRAAGSSFRFLSVSLVFFSRRRVNQFSVGSSKQVAGAFRRQCLSEQSKVGTLRKYLNRQYCERMFRIPSGQTRPCSCCPVLLQDRGTTRRMRVLHHGFERWRLTPKPSPLSRSTSFHFHVCLHASFYAVTHGVAPSGLLLCKLCNETGTTASLLARMSSPITKWVTPNINFIAARGIGTRIF